jgi:hypothetical protein
MGLLVDAITATLHTVTMAPSTAAGTASSVYDDSRKSTVWGSSHM